jgi:hypothetical protein
VRNKETKIGIQHPNELEQHNISTVLVALTLGYPMERFLHRLQNTTVKVESH